MKQSGSIINQQQTKYFRVLFLLPLFLLLLCILFIGLNVLVKPKHTESTSLTTILEKTNVSALYKQYRTEKSTAIKIQSMSLDEKIGQIFMVSIPTYFVDANTKKLITDEYIGGIVLMGGNISTQNQVKDLIQSIQDSAKTDLLIATDQEGGVVARIIWDPARYISQPHIGLVDREDFAYETGKTHALTLQKSNINMNLAPVLDIALVPKSIMSTRSLGADSEKVSKLGVQIIKAHEDEGIIACAKHFPGIGRSTTDSHLNLPVIDISKEQLLSEELVPFKSAIEQGVDVIMIGHAKYPQIDDEFPSSLSSKIITDILRNELNFQGVILTDDMRMGALNEYLDKFVQSFNAGVDMILLVDSYENQQAAIDQIKKAVEDGKISQEKLDESVKRILKLKYEKQIL